MTSPHAGPDAGAGCPRRPRVTVAGSDPGSLASTVAIGAAGLAQQLERGSSRFDFNLTQIGGPITSSLGAARFRRPAAA